MPPEPFRPQALQWQVFRGSEALRRHLLTRHQLRGKGWLRLLHDVYADARLERDHALKCRAALLRLPPEAVLAGPSAAYVHGVRHAATFRDDVHVIVPPTVRVGPQRGLSIHRMEIDTSDITTVAGAARTTPARTACDVATWFELDWAVSVIDALLGHGLLRPADLAAQVGHWVAAGRPGSRRAQLALALADGRAQSPPESRLRVRLVLAGLPKPVPQYPVPLPSGVTVHPDLAWPEFRVAVEYDGQWHGEPEQLHRDRRRLNQLAAEGWIVLHVTSRRLQYDFTGVVREIKAALVSRGWRP